jgi:hypothetical protein
MRKKAATRSSRTSRRFEYRFLDSTAQHETNATRRPLSLLFWTRRATAPTRARNGWKLSRQPKPRRSAAGGSAPGPCHRRDLFRCMLMACSCPSGDAPASVGPRSVHAHGRQPDTSRDSESHRQSGSPHGRQLIAAPRCNGTARSAESPSADHSTVQEPVLSWPCPACNVSLIDSCLGHPHRWSRDT